MSLDGYIAGPKGELDWATMKDDEMGNFLITDLLKTVDTMLLGRMLYKGFESYWPAAALNPSTPKDLVDFARWIEDTPKIVFSRTLEKTEWKNSKIIKGNLEDEIRELKKQPGGDIVLFGGASMSSAVVSLGLVDEYRLKLEPVILGSGKYLFKDNRERMNLKLTKCKKFKSGVAVLYYTTKKKIS